MSYCALCGKHPASAITDLDGRNVPACASCLEPVPDPAPPPGLTQRVLRAARRLDQFTASDLTVALDVGSHAALAVRTTLYALSGSGELRKVSARAKSYDLFEITELGRLRAS